MAAPTVALPPVPDVRKALQHATTHLHAEVDSALPLASAAPTLADYHEHLAVLLDWMTGLRPLHPALAGLLEAQQERLRFDLKICAGLLSGQPDVVPAVSSLALPLAGALPPAAPGVTRASLAPGGALYGAAIDWGVAYVIEGSQLGGQVLHRRLAAALAPHPLDYLKGVGTATGRHWMAFFSNLRAHVVTPEQQAAACDGAVQAFESLLRCFRARRARRASASASASSGESA